MCYINTIYFNELTLIKYLQSKNDFFARFPDVLYFVFNVHSDEYFSSIQQQSTTIQWRSIGFWMWDEKMGRW